VILHGVDFSGADGGGAAKIRIVERDFDKPRSPIVSRGRADRQGLLRQIRECAAGGRRHVWRIDAPFSLPIETLDAFRVPHDWMAMARWMRDFGSPRGWRHEIRSVSRREPKRECDPRRAHADGADESPRLQADVDADLGRALAPRRGGRAHRAGRVRRSGCNDDALRRLPGLHVAPVRLADEGLQGRRRSAGARARVDRHEPAPRRHDDPPTRSPRKRSPTPKAICSTR
jgi:hypothetical protein